MKDQLLIPTFFCPKTWEGMQGNEATRFCSYCHKHVHNLEVMSLQERKTLLASPAASICGRYRVAIRRPAPGSEEEYMRRVFAGGAGIALASSLLFVFWEMQTDDTKRTFFRTVASVPGMQYVIPAELYEERHYMILGGIGSVLPTRPSSSSDAEPYLDIDAAALAPFLVATASQPTSCQPDI